MTSLISTDLMARLANDFEDNTSDFTGEKLPELTDFDARQPHDPVTAMKRMIAADYAAMREDADMGATCGETNNGNWYIDTRMSRNPRYSNNGGDYNYWTEYWYADGKTYRQERSSCDFWQPQDEPENCDGLVDFTVY